MKLTILGSSSALPTSARNPSAHVLNAHERLYLIDCGEGTQMQLRKCGIRIGKINHIFISHLHGDHVFGLYGLISTFNLMGRKNPLYLYAPENYGDILKSHLNDFDIRTEFEIVFKGLKSRKPEIILDDKHLVVMAFPLKHRIRSFGFVFREKAGDRKLIKSMIELHNIPVSQRQSIKKGADLVKDDGTVIKNEEITLSPPKPLSYAYCSDTSFFGKLPEYVKDVDLIYHEATFDSSKSDLAKMTGHSTAADAARVASFARAGKLLIGHFSSRYKNINLLLNEARAIFPETYPAEDGKTYIISDNSSV